MRDNYLADAFAMTASREEGWYVALMERVRWYGGPEEGGWYGTDTHVVKYRRFDTEADALYEAGRIKGDADRMSALARTAHGDRCLAELDWLEARGLDADWLPEADQETYEVIVTQGFPQETRGTRGYS